MTTIKSRRYTQGPVVAARALVVLGAGFLLLVSNGGAADAQSTISSRYVGRPSVIVDLSVLDKFGPAPTLASLLRKGSTSLTPGTAARAPGQLLAPPKNLPRSQLTIPKDIASKRPAPPPPKPRVVVRKPVPPTPPAVAAVPKVPKAPTVPKSAAAGNLKTAAKPAPIPPAAPAITAPALPAVPKTAAPKAAKAKIATPPKPAIPAPPKAIAAIPAPPKATAAVPQIPVVSQPIPKAPSPPAETAKTSSEQLAARTSPITVSDGGNKLRILFGEESSNLPEAATPALEKLAEKLNSDRKLRILLNGFAGGSPDTPSKARRLSLFRALAVRTQLMSYGVRSTRMQLRALGSRADEGPPDRVDIVVAN